MQPIRLHFLFYARVRNGFFRQLVAPVVVKIIGMTFDLDKRRFVFFQFKSQSVPQIYIFDVAFA